MKEMIEKTAVRICFMLSALLLAITACGPDPFFIPVKHIDGVPDTGVEGKILPLNGKVTPDFATYKDISWIVTDNGNTVAVIKENRLVAVDSGLVSIRAVIANGTAEGRDYTQDFIVTIREIKVINNILELEQYLSAQPANTPGYPYFIKLELDFNGVASTLNNYPDKYVGLDFSNTIQTIMENTFFNCKSIVEVTIPVNVKAIGALAFCNCYGLTSVTFEGFISFASFADDAFPGDLRDKYMTGGIGTYITNAPADDNSVWKKQ
ncbi:MAG: leucine-rich repeat domain-containing protein [Treponema sp.]|jgi:hypothetical protein|nr:leucine-rich repeat domain-containing protein [Treponema sp.]